MLWIWLGNDGLRAWILICFYYSFSPFYNWSFTRTSPRILFVSMWLFLLRVMFGSGIIKFTRGHCWQNLTCLFFIMKRNLFRII
ncbi:hypothetical protein DID78_03310 [Candidatus Marinamargulisbacteria bacterium SCGC AG-343-D04]|nr:hypothetical protein DID78_03310 [Candidatus Marinamargulisbacteria bacterium SCGC AG-343-D04]